MKLMKNSFKKLVIIVVYSTSQAQILSLHDAQATSLHHVDKSNVFYWLWEDLIAFFWFFFGFFGFFFQGEGRGWGV